jgi:CelD/BcsL family acetyltransferase involved in cellulose biosynthesis
VPSPITASSYVRNGADAPSAALLGLRDLGEDVLAAWSELAARAVEPNAFFHPDMAVAAARHLRGGGHDRLLAVFGDGGALELALPVRRAARYRRVPVPAYRAWGHAQAFLDTPLVAPGDPVRAWTAALGALRSSGAGWLVFERLPGDGPVRGALEAALPGGSSQVRVLLQHERPVLCRRPEPTYVDGRLSGQRRKRLRRQGRNLESELGAPLRVVDQAEADLGGALDRFLEIELAGWKGQAGTALASDPGEAAFFRAAMTAFARRGCAQVWELGTPERTVASLCAIVEDGAVFHTKTAYDEALAAHSPGLQLELALVDEFHRDSRLAWVDSCTAAGPSPSALLYPDRRPIETVVVPLGGIRARAGAHALQRGMRGRAWARERSSALVRSARRASPRGTRLPDSCPRSP